MYSMGNIKNNIIKNNINFSSKPFNIIVSFTNYDVFYKR